MVEKASCPKSSHMLPDLQVGPGDILVLQLISRIQNLAPMGKRLL